MADYYVRPSVGNDTNGGTSWASDSWATLKKATDTVTAGDHTIWMDTANADVITTNTTYTLAAGVRIVSTSDGSTYTAGATVSSTTFGVDIAFNGKGALFGITLKPATTGGSNLTMCASDDDTIYAEDCVFDVVSSSTSTMTIGNVSGVNVYFISRNCKWRFGAAASTFSPLCSWLSYGDAFCDSGTVLNTMFTPTTGAHNRGLVRIEGGDFSALSSKTLMGATSSPFRLELFGCKMPASFTTMTSGASLGHSELFMFDCSYDDAGALTYDLFLHENYLGKTTVTASIYANDGAQYDGTNRCSWVVDGSSNSNYNRHYISPFIDVWNDDVSTSITPYLEVLRDGSASAYNNDEVWVEFGYKGTANEARYTFVNDRRGVASSNAAQDSSSKSGSDWTGENATAWFGKLAATAAFTPAEVGHIRARVCVAGDHTVYVDPQIRGLA